MACVFVRGCVSTIRNDGSIAEVLFRRNENEKVHWQLLSWNPDLNDRTMASNLFLLLSYWLCNWE